MSVPIEKHFTIILGATPHESHIIKYHEEHPEELIVTISNGTITNTNTSTIISHIDMDFNNVSEWLKLKETYRQAHKIIVDWSTSKFFHQCFNIVHGEVFNIIKELLKNGGCFYSPYRSGMRMIIEEYDGKKLPLHWQYIAIVPCNFLSCAIEEDPNLTEYIDKLNWFGAETHEAEDGEYPINNIHAVYPMPYMTYRV